jgi:hypothetical protein
MDGRPFAIALLEQGNGPVITCNGQLYICVSCIRPKNCKIYLIYHCSTRGSGWAFRIVGKLQLNKKTASRGLFTQETRGLAVDKNDKCLFWTIAKKG